MRDTLDMQSSTVQPYLFFAGRCEEALEFYEQTLGANVLMKMRYGESPQALPQGTIPEGYDAKIMHATFQVGQMTLMAADGSDDKAVFEGFRLALRVESESVCVRLFNALAEGGRVDMPLVKTFWSSRYGMLTDRFGVGWMLMVAEESA